MEAIKAEIRDAGGTAAHNIERKPGNIPTDGLTYDEPAKSVHLSIWDDESPGYQHVGDEVV